MQTQTMARTLNKSVAGFAERSVIRQPAQPMSRIVPPREVRTTTPNVHPAHLRPEISPYNDPVEHWINQKLKNLEKRDRSCLREQPYHASTHSNEQFQPVAVEAEHDARNDRPSLPTIQTLCKDIRSNQPGAMGQGDRVTERCFYRSPAVKTDLRTTRVVLSTGTRTSERNIRRSRPLTASTESHNPSLTKAESKHGVTRTSNKCEEACSIEQIGAAVRSAISAHERRSARVSSPCKGAAPSRRSLGVSNSRTPMSDRLQERLRNVQREAPAFHCHFKEN
ncbi:uncharacterized protein LOC124413401 [Diprion similis]|uniref:uncharacterized protein LOC124413401 n=1 Tax=Diprion similis TaxID=362088 RepID=UPI001EF9ABFA|nr:uncharacterized protein LOC124413401 [Diprion similis]